MNIAIASNFTTDIISSYLKKISADTIFSVGYNQYMTSILDLNSGLYKSNPDILFIFLDGNLLFKDRTLQDVKAEITNLSNSFFQNTDSYLVISNILLYEHANKILDYNADHNIKKAQNLFNIFLNDLSVENNRFFVLDILSIIEKYGYLNIFDNGLWLYGAHRYSSFGLDKILSSVDITIKAIKGINHKCLILDLDNTLWGGILGDEGTLGIKIGTDRIGEIYSKVQKIVLSIKHKGILLCICSKNNETDVIEAFNNNPNIILKYTDFIIKKVNWEQKDKNIIEIVNQLQIGQDSCVFIDDSKFERDLVKSNTNVNVPDFPDQIDMLVDFFSEVDFKYFSKFKLTSEDLEKTKQYIDNFKRSEIKKEFNSLDEYLISLELKLSIKVPKITDIPRLAQLTQKTNQFNFTTIRYTENDLIKILNDLQYKTYYLNLKDKFGEYGIIGLIILKEFSDNFLIESFLLSCRVIGRRIEENIIFELKKHLSKHFIGVYYPNYKNVLLENKYTELGFELIFESQVEKKYILKQTPKINEKLIEVNCEF